MEEYPINQEGFSDIVETFDPITPENAQNKIDAANKEIIFIGRPTCPFCQKFAPKLKTVADDHHLIIHYIFSQDPTYQEEIDALREKYQIETVPALILTDETPSIKCDSSMSIEEIEQFIGL